MIRSNLATLIIAFTFVLTPASFQADEDCGEFDVATHVFDVSDEDGDGFLNSDEFSDAGLARYGAPFEAYDADGDGLTSLDEYYDLYDRHHALDEGRLES